MTPTASLLTAPGNYAVVQLPGRNFPGVVFQGDSLNAMIGALQQALSAPDGQEVIEDLIETLLEVRASYEAVCDRENLSLPYPKAVPGSDADQEGMGDRAAENKGPKELLLPDDFDDYAWEVERKGWFAHAAVLIDGTRQDVTFYDPVRLQQDIEMEIERGPVFLEDNIVVIPAVTRPQMELGIAEMAARADNGATTGQAPALARDHSGAGNAAQDTRFASSCKAENQEGIRMQMLTGETIADFLKRFEGFDGGVIESFHWRTPPGHPQSELSIRIRVTDSAKEASVPFENEVRLEVCARQDLEFRITEPWPGSNTVLDFPVRGFEMDDKLFLDFDLLRAVPNAGVETDGGDVRRSSFYVGATEMCWSFVKE